MRWSELIQAEHRGNQVCVGERWKIFQIVSRGDQKRGVNEFTGGRKTMEDIIISATLGCNMNEILIKY